jgi:sugar lactone lactonase YvrE
VRAFATASSAESIRRGNGSTFSLGIFATMLACAAAFLGIGAPAASAAPEAQPGWVQQGAFGEVAEIEPTRNPLAVDSSGNIFGTYQFVSNAHAYRPDGSALGEYMLSGLVKNLAIDPGDDTLYSDEVFGGPITRWLSDGQPTPTYTQDTGFSVPQGAGLVVDPTTHDILVTDPGAEAVYRYDTTGALVATISTPSINPAFIAMEPDGSFYVAPDGGPDVTHLSGAGTVLETIAGAGSPAGIAFEPTKEFLVASVGGKLKTYSATGQFLSEVPGAGAAGLAASGSGLLYGVSGGSINVYGPATVPGVETPVVSNVQTTSAHVSAEVDPGAGPPEGSVAHFEFSADGGIIWTSTPDQNVERTGTEGPDIIEADLTGLLLNTDYLVRVKASNTVASTTSAAASFSTPEIAPVVETGSVGDRSETSATLYGTVNPGGLQTTYHFEYGTTNSYGSRVPLATEAPAGNLRVPREVSRLVSGLQPGTTYHYRLVAENAVGETAGVDRTFTTLAPSETFPQRAYEQVTPVDKGGAALNSDWNVHAAADGSAIVVNAVAASKDAESALILGNYLSRRGSSDWLDWEPLDPPQEGMAGINESVTAGISADFEHALVISNHDLAPGGIAAGGNLYVKDLVTGEYAFVGGAPGFSSWESLTVIQTPKKIFIASAPDMSWVIFQTKISLLPGVAGGNVYRWSEADGLSVVSDFPGSPTPPFAASGWPAYTFPVVSSDGHAVAYGFEPGGSRYGPIFRRVDGNEPTPVSVSHRSENFEELLSGYLEGMTPDGRYVFFSSASRLTEDSPEESNSINNLYRYDALSEELIYVDRVEASTGPTVYGFSDDGQTIYYYADDGPTRIWQAGQTQLVSNENPSREGVWYVTKNGRYMGWADVPQVTDTVEQEKLRQAHLYDAETGQTVCVSCPTSGKPAGAVRLMKPAPNLSNRSPRIITEDGTMFFDTPTRLLAADHNGKDDVYAYQDGRQTLISPGDEDFAAFFVDASADGNDVFFQTNQGLVAQDVDGNADVYDARIGGGFAAQNPPPPPGSCQATECAEAGGPPAGGPPTATGASLPDRTGQQAGKVTIKKAKIGLEAARVTIHASQPGKVSITGGAVKATGRQLTKPGTYTISVPLTTSAQAKRGEGVKLKVALTVRLSGSWGAASAKYSKTLGK